MDAIVLSFPGPRPGAATPTPRGRLATTVDLADYRRTAEPPDPSCCWACEAHGVIDEVEVLLHTGRGDEVLEFCQFAAACLADGAPLIADADEVRALGERLRDLRLRAGLGRHPSWRAQRSGELTRHDEALQRRGTRSHFRP